MIFMMQHMTDHILKAYETDIDFRINGFEKANESGYRVEVTEIESGIIYKDDRVTVEAGYEGYVVNGKDLDVF